MINTGEQIKEIKKCAYPDCVLVNWTITYNPKPIPDRSHDYDFVHVDYDGAPDSEDIRSGTAKCGRDAIEKILEIEEEI